MTEAAEGKMLALAQGPPRLGLWTGSRLQTDLELAGRVCDP